MKLTELEARFLKREADGVTSTMVDDIAEADGVMFLCPKCFELTDSNRGVHSVICWQPRVPKNVNPSPGRWSFSGTGLHDLTLTGNPSSSVLLTHGCRAHFHVRNGEVV